MGDDRDFVTRLGIGIVEEAARQHFQVANVKILPGNAERQDVALLAAGDGNAVVVFDQRRSVADTRYLLAYGIQIVEGEKVAVDVAAVNAAAGILGDHHVGADVLNLLQQILLAG